MASIVDCAAEQLTAIKKRDIRLLPPYHFDSPPGTYYPTDK
jgi:hypothetical protein